MVVPVFRVQGWEIKVISRSFENVLVNQRRLKFIVFRKNKYWITGEVWISEMDMGEDKCCSRTRKGGNGFQRCRVK